MDPRLSMTVAQNRHLDPNFPPLPEEEDLAKHGFVQTIFPNEVGNEVPMAISEGSSSSSSTTSEQGGIESLPANKSDSEGVTEPSPVNISEGVNEPSPAMESEGGDGRGASRSSSSAPLKPACSSCSSDLCDGQTCQYPSLAEAMQRPPVRSRKFPKFPKQTKKVGPKTPTPQDLATSSTTQAEQVPDPSSTEDGEAPARDVGNVTPEPTDDSDK